MKYFYIVSITISFLFTNCKQKENKLKTKNQIVNVVKHAKGFSIEKYTDFSILKVTNAYPEATESYTYVLHKKEVTLPDSW